MTWPSAKDAVRRLWSRRWVRRVSYALVGGATLATVTPWIASRPAVLRWVVGQADALVREETGLPLAIGARPLAEPRRCSLLRRRRSVRRCWTASA